MSTLRELGAGLLRAWLEFATARQQLAERNAVIESHAADVRRLQEAVRKRDAELEAYRERELGPIPEGALKALGGWLASQFDDDKWPIAEGYLNAALAELLEERKHAEAMHSEAQIYMARYPKCSFRGLASVCDAYRAFRGTK